MTETVEDGEYKVTATDETSKIYVTIAYDNFDSVSPYHSVLYKKAKTKAYNYLLRILEDEAMKEEEGSE